jgi:hypothetical protein
MPEYRVKFSSLRRMLLDLGFAPVPLTKPNIGFKHAECDLLIALPAYRSNALVAPHHLVYVRMMLDGKGLLDADEFDRRLAEVPARNPA